MALRTMAMGSAAALQPPVTLRIRKKGAGAAARGPGAGAVAAAAAKVEPQVQFHERADGQYDLVLLCGCGQRHTVRLESLESAP